MAVPTGVRTSQVLNAQTITWTVTWALQSGDPGFGVSGITQSGTATYTATVPAAPTPIPGVIQNILDTLDQAARGGNAVFALS